MAERSSEKPAKAEKAEKALKRERRDKDKAENGGKRAKNGHANGHNGHAMASVATLDIEAAAATTRKAGHTSRASTINVELLRHLSETPGVSGREERVRALVIEQLTPLVDEISVDALGNVIAIKHGSSDRRVMLAAHMDEIGFMVRYIEERGFLRIQPLGGFDARVLVAQRVIVHTRSGEALHGALTPATKPIHLLGDEKPAVPKLEEFYVDLGLPGERVRELVSIGDSITLDRTCELLGDTVMGKAMDDRSGLFTMIETLRQVGKHEATIIAVATVQEEVGLRGATTAAFQVEPDVAIALDTTLAVDTPGMPETESVTRMGDGVAIKVFDSSAIPNYRLVAHLRAVAERYDIPHQLEVLPRGGTDAGAMQRSRGGAAAITLSIPSRYVHTVNEMVSANDLAAAAQLLARYLEDAHTGDYRL
ncbi:MAG: M42 family metallopeptidase [Ktedonobacterales bacterium]